MEDTRSASPPTAYLDSPLRLGIIFGSFLFLTLPLVFLGRSSLPEPVRREIFFLYAAVIGGSHFFLTLSVYLQGRNLSYFLSSWTNRLAYFAVPFLLFAVFFLGALSPGLLLGSFAAVVLIRAADFFHVVRQHFGVLELLKARSRARFPGWMRPAGNCFFILMSALQLETFLNRGRFGWTPYSAATAAAAAALLLALLLGFGASMREPGRKGVSAPLAYFLLQTASASLAVYKFDFYVAGLAMHYVEYHVLMVPRCFQAPLDASRRGDRVMAWLRRRGGAFYGALAGLALWQFGASKLLDGRGALLPLAYLFNGIFVVHYFLDAFIWKFGNPFYRDALAPLYLEPRAEGGGR